MAKQEGETEAKNEFERGDEGAAKYVNAAITVEGTTMSKEGRRIVAFACVHVCRLTGHHPLLDR